MVKNTLIPVVDLFAGPGGLGEGFSAIKDKNGQRIFKIALSIEKDEFAHQTLELRSFFRQFDKDFIPEEYYKHLRRELTRQDLFKMSPEEYQKARREAWKAELGKTSITEIDKRISEVIDNNSWILIGGPPCQAYSVIGRVRHQWTNGLDEKDPRVFLYREYYRIVAVHNPPIFIMENVRGLLSSKLSNNSIFKEILNDLENPAESYRKLHGKNKTKSGCPGYYLYSLVKTSIDSDINGSPNFEPPDFIIKAEEYGIPQKRHRVIILGIRKDLFSKAPDILKKKKTIAINKIIRGLPKLRSGLTEEPDCKENWKKILNEFVNDGITKNIDKNVKESILNIVKNINLPQKDRGDEFIRYRSQIYYDEVKDWFEDSRLDGVCNHTSRAHLNEDIYRYLYAACYAKVKRKSPLLKDFPKILLPNHKNAKEGKFEDRFRVQIYTQPSCTITSHISKDGHYFIHPDPSQCRSLTVREAARIQTFPDNYFFCGPRTSQYTQVGNAVPPLLAKQMAEVVLKIFYSLIDL